MGAVRALRPLGAYAQPVVGRPRAGLRHSVMVQPE